MNCPSDCQGCPTEHEQSGAVCVDAAPGPFQGAAAILRAAVGFGLPLVAALAGAIFLGDAAGLGGLVLGAALAAVILAYTERKACR